MFAFASISLMLFFQCYLIFVIALDENNLHCNHAVRTDRANFSLADCKAAIDMIPTGIAFDPFNPGDRSQSKLIDVYFDRPDRRHPLFPGRLVRKSPFLLPAAFRSRSCVVLVETMTLGPFQPPLQAASAMHTNVWPEVRRAATMILERCHLQKGPRFARWSAFVTGSFNGDILLDGNEFFYRVLVRPAPQDMPGEGWKAYFDYYDDLWYNVYEADGAPYSLPIGYARGFWKFRKGQFAAGLIPPDYRGRPVQVPQPFTQPVFLEKGPSPMDWLEANTAG
jgi:hypothetical protein